VVDHTGASSGRNAGHHRSDGRERPKYYAFLNSGQLVGMLGGMKGAAEYEKLLRGSHPEMERFYGTTRAFTATKGMDGQTVLHTIILLFILLGNSAFLLSRKGAAR
jgi:hypothetical protein